MRPMDNVVCIIPARLASSRFPDKPLKPMLGLALVLHVWERCRLARRIGRLAIATCDQAIADAARAHGAEAVMTADTHPGCVDRTVEAIANLGLDLPADALVLMVQGDEVMVTPEMLDQVIEAFGRDRPAVVNLASRLYRPEDHDDPNAVKVCFTPDGRALFFSRSPIPSRSRAAKVDMFQQTGVIGFRRDFLDTFGRLERTPLEMAEQVDMLRTLEHGYPIRIVPTDTETIGVDTPADLARGERMLAADPTTARYLRRTEGA